MLLRAENITKRFSGQAALQNVNFDLQAGEVHALLGENGAGKSTLVKILTGLYRPDAGVVLLSGNKVNLSSPQHAVAQGISTVYQEVNLAPNLSVAENICLGREPKGPLGIRWKLARTKAEAALARLGLNLDVKRTLDDCSIAEQQLVAIARALDVQCRVLVLDEPTSSLDKREVEQLFGVMRNLRGQGLGIIFVTHFLDQIYEISDRMTVLRNGQLVGEYGTAGTTRVDLVTAMIGRHLSHTDTSAPIETAPGEPILSAKNVARNGSVRDVTVTFSEGEAVGIAGLLGSGRTECLKLFFGIDAPSAGELKLRSKSVRRMTIRLSMAQGLGFNAEDRKTEAIFPDLTVHENMMIAKQVKQGFWRRLPQSSERAKAQQFVEQLSVKLPSLDAPMQTLSGGNQQKVLLARWLATSPKLLLLDEPTRGIDIGARHDIEHLLRGLNAQGTATCMVSSDVEELLRCCQRILVMRDQKMVATLRGGDLTESKVIDSIAGVPS